MSKTPIPNSWIRYKDKCLRDHYSLESLFVENNYPQIASRYDISKFLLLDIVFELLLMKYGTEETIRILKLKERDEYKEALKKDLQFRNANLYFCRRVFRFRKQLKYLKHLYALTGDTRMIGFIYFQCVVTNSPYVWERDRKFFHIRRQKISYLLIEVQKDLKHILKELKYPEYIYFK